MASLPADTVWEVNTTGSDTAAGGGFSVANKGATGTDLTYPTPTITTFTSNLSAVGTTTLTCLSALFTNTMLGNVIQISGQGFFCITGFTSTTVVTVHTAMGTFSTTSGWVGGALASPAVAAANKVASNIVYVKSGTYSITSASTNVAGGCVSDATAAGAKLAWEGYQTTRGDLGTAPILQASGISTFTIFAVVTGAGNGAVIRNLTFDGASLTASKGFNNSNGLRLTCYKCTAKNCTNEGFTSTAIVICIQCIATNITGGTAAFHGSIFGYASEAYSNTVPGFEFSTSNQGGAAFCLSYNNTGASSDGFQINAAQAYLFCNTAYGNGRDGFRIVSGAANPVLINNLAEANSGWSYSGSGTYPAAYLINNAGYNVASGNVNTAVWTGPNIGFVTGSASFFVAAGSSNFALNTTATGGALARATGFPGAFPAGTTTGYHDIGAAQHADPVKLLTVQGMTGGME